MSAHKVSDLVLDATAPIGVNDALVKLCRRYGTERVIPEVRAWLAYIEPTRCEQCESAIKEENFAHFARDGFEPLCDACIEHRDSDHASNAKETR